MTKNQRSELEDILDWGAVQLGLIDDSDLLDQQARPSDNRIGEWVAFMQRIEKFCESLTAQAS